MPSAGAAMCLAQNVNAVAMPERDRKDVHFEFSTLRFRPLVEHGSWQGQTNIVPLREPSYQSQHEWSCNAALAASTMQASDYLNWGRVGLGYPARTSVTTHQGIPVEQTYLIDQAAM